MKEPEDNKSDPLWKALDSFPNVEPHPQSRAQFWARVARDDAEASARGDIRSTRWNWFLRIALPSAGLACVILAIVLGGNALIERHAQDQEIAANLELYENLDVIQNMPQLASYEEPSDEDFDEMVE